MGLAGAAVTAARAALATEAKGAARAEGAHAARRADGVGGHAQRLQVIDGQALALGGGFKRVGAGCVLADQGRAVVGATGVNADRAGAHGAVVPAGQFHGVGVPLGLWPPAVHGVVFDGATALAEAHVGPRVGLEGAIVVGDHQGVGAQCRAAGIPFVFEPVEQAFVGQQALDKGEVAFLVLGGQAALGVDAGLQQIQAPGGDELGAALIAALVAGEDGLHDVGHAQVLEHGAVAPHPQKAQPGLDREAVARQAGVRADVVPHV